MVSIVVPTRNEAANVLPLVTRTVQALGRVDAPFEILFVDDSDDETPAIIRGLPDASAVRLFRREAPERTGGLSGAVLSGFDRARGDVLVVMDADLQHPPELLPDLVQPILDGDCDLAIASRYLPGGSSGGLHGRYRHAVARSARLAAQAVVPRGRRVSDPLGGFFAVRRDVVRGVALRPTGFKILLEIIVRGAWSDAVEVPYTFSERLGGESKAGLREGLRFGRHLARLAWYRTGHRPVPARAARRGGRGLAPYPVPMLVTSAPSTASPGPMSNEQPG